LKNNLIIKLAKKKDKIEIQKFIDSNFKKNHILSRNHKLFKWAYVDKKINCAVALLNKKIVGIYLYIPLYQFDKKLKKNHHIFGSLWTIKGFKKNQTKNFNKKKIIIALRLFQKTFQLVKTDLDIAIGLDARFYKFHKSQGYEKIGKLNHHFIVSPYINKTKILDISILSKTKKIKKNKLKIRYKKIKKISDFKKFKVDNLFKYQIPLKSKIYLIKRYLKHPIYKYHIYLIYNKKALNICVFRIVKFNNTNVIRFIDYVGSNKSFLHLKTFFNEIFILHNAEYLDFYSYGIPLDILKNTGLINKDNNKKIIVPNYFEPFVNKNIDIHIGFRKFNERGKIRIFKGDGDQDRPNFD
tara:strand:+ start:18660 stop:19721 length:1062 start_codon:yes stop_codon:yes gene_type:complete